MTEVWLLVLMTTGSLTVAPQTFATEAACKAVVDQIPKSAGSGRCVKAVVRP